MGRGLVTVDIFWSEARESGKRNRQVIPLERIAEDWGVVPGRRVGGNESFERYVREVAQHSGNTDPAPQRTETRYTKDGSPLEDYLA